MRLLPRLLMKLLVMLLLVMLLLREPEIPRRLLELLTDFGRDMIRRTRGMMLLLLLHPLARSTAHPNLTQPHPSHPHTTHPHGALKSSPCPTCTCTWRAKPTQTSTMPTRAERHPSHTSHHIHPHAIGVPRTRSRTPTARAKWTSRPRLRERNVEPARRVKEPIVLRGRDEGSAVGSLHEVEGRDLHGGWGSGIEGAKGVAELLRHGRSL